MPEPTTPNPDAAELARTSGVPFLEEAVKRAEESAKKPPSPPPTPEPAEDEEVVLVDDAEEQEPTADVDGDLRRELEEAREALERERDRSQRNRADYQRAQAGQELEQGLRRALESFYQEAQAKQYQAQQSQQKIEPPAVDDGEALLVDADRLTQYIESYGEYIQRRMLAQLTPFLQAVGTWDQFLPGVMKDRANVAWSTAKQMLEEEGYSDLDEYKEELEKLFQANARTAASRMEPNAIRLAYLSMGDPSKRRRKATASAPPPSAGASTAPGGKRQKRVVVTRHHREIAQKFGLDPVEFAKRTMAGKGKR